MRAVVWVLLLAASVCIAASGFNGEASPVLHHPHASAPTAVHHIIVKLRSVNPATASSLKTNIAGPGATGAEDRVAAFKAQVEAGQQRVNALATRKGLTLKQSRPITSAMHAIQVEPVGDESIDATLQRLRADPDVEYAEVNQRRYAHHVAPNDTLYMSEQWYFQPVSATIPASIDAQTGWDITTGSANLVIADIDTGVLFDHPDLLTTTNGGRLISPGYCFISDSFVANNASCPGPDATDPGDWVTTADLGQSECSGQQTNSDSTWHGTQTAGLLGAISNNGIGITGLTWQTQILPLRALGKCGGQDSDIATAMLYAAGIPVAPNGTLITNPNPAKVINMSLGGTGSCPSTYADVISQVTAKGVLIVASAGNESGPVDAPGNCPGVAAVAGLRQDGSKSGFSSLGPEVALSAPAGNCVNNPPLTGANPCVYPMTTTFNSGKTTEAINTYSDQVNNPSLGTSFSAPLVSGIGALMASVNANLNSCQLITRLKEGSVAFPQASTTSTTACHVPADANDVQSFCLCTLDGKTCGAGMANAPGALQAALRPIAAVTVPSSVSAGQSFALSASGSAAASNRSISSYSWTSVGTQALTIQNASSASATITAPSCGLGTVRLTVTDSAGSSDTTDIVVSPASATSTAPTTASGSNACSLTTPAVELDVCPATNSIQTGAGSQSFTATVANTTNTSVSSWEVNGIAGGNSTVGTITSAGIYTPPAKVPSPASVTITAVADADTAVSGSATVTITAPPKSGGGGSLDYWTLACGTLVLYFALIRRIPAARVAKA